ncbi:recombinase family protein [Mesorhizobium sp. IRAMC:0171]|uniref:Recombinase family protein n=1 Tax=Mesorhizobium retamae TaxID=2912854 RepID=A0ABS9QNN5_9HYPH|nr:recombinase family protein [Mesorhizobium sp. IRAMC:0171]MCG7509065.1 recombinase family protein [Mesorhizobium sp. IRAMC:0171]
MKVAIYARYSSDSQRDASIADQLRMCRLYAERERWQVVEEYTDHAISGASLLRPGIQALISDGTRGRFNLILAEAMDRLSRDQEDIAGVFKRMSYSDVKIFTLSEGEVTHLHVGLKGTMNALFLKDLADKTRRGQRGRIEAGKSGGGNSYGYDVVKKYDSQGELVRGDRAINEKEANVVRRIFRDYSIGKSAKAIATALNKDGIPSPSGGVWGFSTISGNPKRANGILNNEMYIGKLVWNRQRFVKDPDTGKRQARPNPESEWVTQETPELRIVDDELWRAVKARQAKNAIGRDDMGNRNFATATYRRRPKHLFSGLLKCACCGGGYSAISATHLGCSTARNKGTCSNRVNIRRDELESRVLNALRNRMLDPNLFAEFCDAYTQETNRLRIESRANIEAAESELERIAREVQKLMDLYLKDALSVEDVKERGDKLRARKTELTSFLETVDEPPPLLHPAMAQQYRMRVLNLYEALQHDSEEKRMEAAEIIRSLVEDINLKPENRKIAIEVRGDLAGILMLSVQTKNPAGKAGSSQVKLVAGVGFEPTTFRL